MEPECSTAFDRRSRMVVMGDGLAAVLNSPTGATQSPTEVGILVIEEEVFIKQANLTKGTGSQRGSSATEPKDIGTGVVGVSRFEPASVLTVTVGPDLVTCGIDKHNAVNRFGQQHPRS